jgi:hypothetical protein
MESKVLHIGRGDENEIILKHPSISRRHAQLFFDPDGNAFISDLQSTNGTFVNGQKVTSGYSLNRGDKVELGDRVGLDWERYKPEDKNPAASVPLSPPAAERKKSSTNTIILAVVLGVMILATGSIIVINSTSSDKPKKNGNETQSQAPPPPSGNSISMNVLLNTGKDKLNAYVGHTVTECPSDTILYSKVEPMCYFIIQNGKFLDYKTPKVATAPAPVEPAPPVKVGGGRKKPEPKPPVIPKATTTSYKVHKVAKGQTLDDIVKLFISRGCSTKKQKIMDYNGLNNENDFEEDDILYIPCN